ncbi:hypothetical protein ONZ45_g9033 [Pleurotus djamor]|nr:hypothetical protein ONZ45_g9033 [Pleurotus djamor]
MGNKSIFYFLKVQWSTVPPVEKADLTGKTAIVIGANTGIGFETAKHFALMGAEKVILACRSKQKGDDAVKRIQEATGNKGVELKLVDLSSFASVQAFVQSVEDLEKIDILVANAAAVMFEYELTKDGWESALEVNHLAPALLILLLLPKIFKAAESYPSGRSPRIVIVSSELHQYGKIPKQALKATSPLEVMGSKEVATPYNNGTRYNLVKRMTYLFAVYIIIPNLWLLLSVLNVLLARGFTKHLPQSSPTIVVNSVNPGLCVSELRRGMSRVLNWVLEHLLNARTSEEGARQVVYASVATEGGSEEPMKGAFITFAQADEPGDFALSPEGKEFQESLWSDTLRILSKVDTRVQPIINQYLKN